MKTTAIAFLFLKSARETVLPAVSFSEKETFLPRLPAGASDALMVEHVKNRNEIAAITRVVLFMIGAPPCCHFDDHCKLPSELPRGFVSRTVNHAENVQVFRKNHVIAHESASILPRTSRQGLPTPGWDSAWARRLASSIK